MKKLVIITGISGSGKTTLAKKLYDYYDTAILLSVDAIKENIYELVGFSNREQKKNLKEEIYQIFQNLLEVCMRREDSLIFVEYPFGEKWKTFFQTLSTQYQYEVVTIQVYGASFDEIWNRLEKRNNSRERQPSHSLSSYHPKEKDSYRSSNELDYWILKKDYETNKYTSLALGKVIRYDSNSENTFKEIIDVIS